MLTQQDVVRRLDEIGDYYDGVGPRPDWIDDRGDALLVHFARLYDQFAAAAELAGPTPVVGIESTEERVENGVEVRSDKDTKEYEEP